MKLFKNCYANIKWGLVVLNYCYQPSYCFGKCSKCDHRCNQDFVINLSCKKD